MSLISLKNEPDEGMDAYRMNNFGYGTEIHLNGEQCEKLGISAAMKVGQPVTIKAAGLVVRSIEEIEYSTDSGGKDVSMCIQLTEIEVKASGTASAKRAQDILYGNEE